MPEILMRDTTLNKINKLSHIQRDFAFRIVLFYCRCTCLCNLNCPLKEVVIDICILIKSLLVLVSTPLNSSIYLIVALI